MKNLNLSDYLVGALVATVAAVPFSLFMRDVFAGVGAGLLGGAIAVQARRKYLDALSARMLAVDGGVVWDVQVNGVKVASISDAEYARLRMDVFNDLRTYVGQAGNLARCAAKILDFGLLAIPAAVFWLGVATFVVMPEDTVAALQQLRDASSQNLAASLRFFLSDVVPVLTIIAVGVNIAVVRARFGYRNIFREQCAERLKFKLSVPTPGDVDLVTMENGAARYNDEASYLRAKRT